MQRIALTLCLLVLPAATVSPARGQPGDSPERDAIDPYAIEPLIPPGIADSNLEVYGKLAYTWPLPDGTQVAEINGDFSARMGQYSMRSNDAVIWLSNRRWQDQPYVDAVIFLWQNAEVIQPAGTIETGPALLITLRTFGRFALNADGHAAHSHADGALYQEALKAKRLLDVVPAERAETTDAPLQLSQTPEQLRLSLPKPPRQVFFNAKQTTYEQHRGRPIIVAIGDVFVSQGSPAASGEYVEIRADAAVLYVNEQAGGALPGLLNEGDGAKDRRVPPSTAPGTTRPGAPRLDEGKPSSDAEAVGEWISAVYLEGDVILTRGQRMIRASKLYYDFNHEQALILDAVTRASEPSRQVPIYVRAEEIRQLSGSEYQANKAVFTTSEFYTPHVAIGASKVYLKDRTPRDEAGQIIGVQAGTYKAYHTTLNMDGLPIAYWPFSRGDFSRDRMAFRSAKIGHTDELGTGIETRWYFFNLLGLEAPEGFDATYKLDYFSERGPATGLDMDYETDDYYGLFRGYYINDGGEDELGRDRDVEPPHPNRGRALWRHRQYLPGDWELTLEGAYLSDASYLEEFERKEFENGKTNENAIYLVKRQDNWQFSSLANWHINEFITETEHLPDNTFSLIGEPLGEYATLYSESRLGAVRYRFEKEDQFGLHPDRTFEFRRSGSVVRGDTREEAQFPLPDLGPLKLTPYATGRLTGWDDGPRRVLDSDDGGFGRAFGAVGVHGDMLFTKVDETIESEILDVHRLRHVIKPDFGLWAAAANENSDDLTPFDDGVEDIADASGGTVGLRQKFQTQRGGPGRWRTVDWIVFDVEGGFFDGAEKDENTHGDYIFSRPEDSISSNFIATNFQYRVSDSTVLVHDSVFDLNEGNLGTSNVSLAVEREPRLAYFVGWRYIHDTESNLLALGGNYKLSEKHTVAVRELYDIEEGRNHSTELIYIRKWPRWYTAVVFDVDRTLDDFGINLSIWPEGAPRLGLGSKRYTGLADDIGVDVR